MEWESPWGTGFPGWHLECSVIAYQTLGEQIDIHTGGIDHIPVHHTNEIAQTESVTGKQFSKIWFHNNHIKINGEKLSKSLGNSYTLSDLVERGFDLESFKLMVISSHYRTEGNFSFDILTAAKNRINNWKMTSALVWQSKESQTDKKIIDLISKASEEIIKSLSNDLNTPAALKVIDELFSKIPLNKYSTEETSKISEFIQLIKDLLNIDVSVIDIPESAKELISKREILRQSKSWEAADAIRTQLSDQGITLNDSAGSVVWSWA